MKPISKKHIERAECPGDRMFIDISSSKFDIYGGNDNWLLALDDATDMPFSFFIDKKSELSLTLIPFIKGLEEDYGISVKRIRMEYAGENLAFARKCKEEGMNIRFKITAPNTPQQNGRRERKFATLWGRTRAMLDGSCWPLPRCNRLWTEAASLATDLDSIYIRPGETMDSFTKFFGKGNKRANAMMPSAFQRFLEKNA